MQKISSKILTTMKTLKLICCLSLIIVFTACKKEEPKPIEPNPIELTPIDYRDKWCGDYEFTTYINSWSPSDVTLDTLHYTGKVYYTKDMQENEIFIQNINIITIDTNGVFILSKIDRGRQEGKFIGNDSLYYFVAASPGQSHSYTHERVGRKIVN